MAAPSADPAPAVADAALDPVQPGPTPLDPAQLHPALWRASQLGGGRKRCSASGFDALDAQLPGGGWPHGELTELLLPRPGIGELRLLAPVLAAIDPPGDARAGTTAAPRCVMLFDPPAALSAWGLAQQGLDGRHWLVVAGRQPAAASTSAAPAAARRAPRDAGGLAPLLPAADLLWALEQALRSGQVGAVLAWLPQRLRADALRRLQLAAQAHDGPLFVFRHASLRSQPSVAALRLLLQPQGVDGLSLRLLKRRGPTLAAPLRVQLPPVLSPGQQARAQARQALADAAQHARRPRWVPG